MKAPDAFRSISEVAAALDVRQHTLRSWETRFPFVKPVKRPDGRRYYRPVDVVLLTELNRLLVDEKLSTEAILRLHRHGELGPRSKPRASSSGLAPWRVHLATLTAARERLVGLIH